MAAKTKTKPSVLEQFKTNFKVLKTVKYGGGEAIVFESGGRTFHLCQDGKDCTIRTAYDKGAGDWGLGPSSKTAKTIAPLLRFLADYGG